MPRRKTTKRPARKKVTTLTHKKARRKNIPTAEHRALVEEGERHPVRVAYERRNPDLDPQLVWRGKDALNENALTVSASPLYIQEKVHPKVLVDDLLRESARSTPPPPRGRPIYSVISMGYPVKLREQSSTNTTPTGPTA